MEFGRSLIEMFCCCSIIRRWEYMAHSFVPQSHVALVLVQDVCFAEHWVKCLLPWFATAQLDLLDQENNVD